MAGNQLDTEDMNRLENSLRSIVDTIMSRVESSKPLKRAGELGALAGAGYGMYQFANSPVGEPITTSATQYAQAGMGRMQQQYHTGKALSNPRDPYGTFYSPGIKADTVTNQAINNASAGLVGGASAGISTAATFGGGALLNTMGVTGAVSSATGATGSALGGFALGAPISWAGKGIGSALSGFGMNNAANFVTGATNTIAGGASSAGSLIGGALGGFVPGLAGAYAINKSTQAVTNNLASQRNIERDIGAASFRFTPGMATNLVTGRGLSYEDRSDLAIRARESLVDERFVRQEDFGEIFQGVMENDLLYNVRGAEEFQDKFEKVTESLTDIAQIYGTTLEEATDMLGEMQRSGFYTIADQSRTILNNDAIGRMTGRTGEEVTEIGQGGSQTTRSYGMGGALGHEIATALLLSKQHQVENLEDTPYMQQEFYELIEEIGGEDQAIQTSTDFLVRTANQPKFKEALFGMVDTETGQIDEERLEQFLNGEISFKDALSAGATSAAQNQEMYEEFKNNANQYYEQMSGTEFSQFMTQGLKGMQSIQGYESIQTLLNELGMQNPKVRQFFEQLLEGAEELSEAEQDLRRINEQVRKDRILNRSPSGMLENVRHFGEQVGFGMATPFVGAYQQMKEWGTDIRNRWYGIDEIDTDFGNYDVNANLNNEEILSMIGENGAYVDESDPNATLDRIRLRQRRELEGLTGLTSSKVEDIDITDTFSDKGFTNLLKGAVTAMEDKNRSIEDIKLADVLPEEELNKLPEGISPSLSLKEYMERSSSFTEDQIQVLENIGTEFTQKGNMREKYLGKEIKVTDEMKELFGVEGEKPDNVPFSGLYSNRISIGDFMDTYQNMDNLTEEQKSYIEQFEEEYDKDGLLTFSADDLIGDISGIEELVGVENAKELSQQISEKVIKSEMGRYRSQGQSNIAERLGGFIETEGSLVDKFTSLYDDRLIESLDNGDMKNLLSIGEGFSSGDTNVNETISRLQSYGISEKQLERLQNNKQDKEAFQQTVNEILTTEFVESTGEEGTTALYGTSTEEYEDQWRDASLEALNNSNKAVNDMENTIRDIPFDELKSALDNNTKAMNRVQDKL